MAEHGPLIMSLLPAFPPGTPPAEFENLAVREEELPELDTLVSVLHCCFVLYLCPSFGVNAPFIRARKGLSELHTLVRADPGVSYRSRACMCISVPLASRPCQAASKLADAHAWLRLPASENAAGSGGLPVRGEGRR